jgi:hypothetical protein
VDIAANLVLITVIALVLLTYLEELDDAVWDQSHMQSIF